MAFGTSPYSYWLASGNPFAAAAKAQFDAMGKLARIGTVAMQQVVKQQQDMAQTVMGRWRETAATTPTEPGALMGLPLEAARLGTELALRNAGELAEIARQTQTEMLAVLTARAEQTATGTADAVAESVTETVQFASKAAVNTPAATGAGEIALAGRLVE